LAAVAAELEVMVSLMVDQVVLVVVRVPTTHHELEVLEQLAKVLLEEMHLDHLRLVQVAVVVQEELVMQATELAAQAELV
jgi:mannitol/fructose-specific phosphotransferase system IIA component (Ntr-type)